MEGAGSVGDVDDAVDSRIEREVQMEALREDSLGFSVDAPATEPQGEGEGQGESLGGAEGAFPSELGIDIHSVQQLRHVTLKHTPEGLTGGTMVYPQGPGGSLSASVGVLPFIGHRIGRMKHCCRGRCFAGPCWPMPFVTTAVILFLGGLLFKAATLHASVWVLLLGGLGIGMTLVTFWLTAYSNPGIAERFPERPPDCETWPYHDRARSFQPAGCKWCAECEVFVRGYDHFCPWTGTTIGAGNMPYFMMFLSSMCATMVFLIGALVLS